MGLGALAITVWKVAESRNPHATKPDWAGFVLFTGSLLIEVIFSLDGIGLLGFESALNRDYPVMFGTLYIFTLLGLLMQIVGDVMYTLVDPRIDFEARK